MKKKYTILTYIIFTFIICFSCSYKAQADELTCDYFLGNVSNSIHEGDEYYEDYIKFYNNIIFSSIRNVNSNNFAVLPSIKESTYYEYMTKLPENTNDVFAYSYYTLSWNALGSTTNSPDSIGDFRLSSLTARYFTESKKVIIGAYGTYTDIYSDDENKTILVGDKDISSTIISEKKYDYCPDAIKISYKQGGGWLGSGTEVRTELIYGVTKNLKYGNFDSNFYSYISNYKNDGSILLFGDYDVEGYNLIDYYNGKICDLKNYDENFKIINDIDSIFKKFDESGFDYVKFYELYNQILEKYKNDKEFDKDKIFDELFKENGELSGEFVKLPYFDNLNDKVEIINEMVEDYNTLGRYQNVINHCFAKKFNLGEDKTKTYDWYKKYQPDSYYQYADIIAQLIDNLVIKVRDDYYIAEIDDTKFQNSINDFVKKSCGDDLICKETTCKKLLPNINCDNFVNMTINSNFDSDTEKNMFIMVQNNLKGYETDPAYGQRLVNACKSIVAETDCLEVVTYTTDAYNKGKEIIKQATYNTIKTTGIEVVNDEELCSWLYGEDGLGIYINGILNAIRIGGPLLVIVLTAFDGIKIISSFKDDENKKFFNKLKIRLICLVILFLVPTVIKFLIKNLIRDGLCGLD